jgi:hypothetical protein
LLAFGPDAPHKIVEQRAALPDLHHAGKVDRLLPAAIRAEAKIPHRRGLVFGEWLAKSQYQFHRKLMIRRPDRLDRGIGTVRNEFGNLGRRRILSAPAPEDEAVRLLAHRQVEEFDDRLQRRARRCRISDDIAMQRAVGVAYISRRQAVIRQYRIDECASIGIAEPAVQPMAAMPVGAVGPAVAARRKGGKRPRVPSPDIGAFDIDHAAAIDRRERISRLFEIRIRRVPVGIVRFEKALLRQVRPAGAGEIRGRILRRFRVWKDVGLVRSLVDRGTAEFVAPGGVELRSAQALRILGGKHQRHRAIVPHQPAPAGLEARPGRARHGEDARRPLDHHLAHIAQRVAHQRDPLVLASAPRERRQPAHQPVHPFGAQPGLAGAAPARHHPGRGPQLQRVLLGPGATEPFGQGPLSPLRPDVPRRPVFLHKPEPVR